MKDEQKRELRKLKTYRNLMTLTFLLPTLAVAVALLATVTSPTFSTLGKWIIVPGGVVAVAFLITLTVAVYRATYVMTDEGEITLLSGREQETAARLFEELDKRKKKESDKDDEHQ